MERRVGKKKYQLSGEHVDLIERMGSAHVALLAARDAFVVSLKADLGLPAWTPAAPDNPQNARYEAAALYGDFNFPQADLLSENAKPPERNEVVKGCGIVGASTRTIELAEAFNEAKKHFDVALKPMRKNWVPVEIEPGKPEHTEKLDRVALKIKGQALLSERQACRQICILKQIPSRVIFSWVNVPSTQRITVNGARKLLRDMTTTPDVAADLRALDGLPEDEPLALFKPLAPHMRVNVGNYVIPDPAKRSAVRKKVLKEKILKYTQYPTAIPVLVPMSPGDQLPKITGPRTDAAKNGVTDGNRQRTKAPRKKQKVGQEPYLRSIGVYRYQQAWREKLCADQLGQDRDNTETG